jgi:hypothetical protein
MPKETAMPEEFRRDPFNGPGGEFYRVGVEP